MCTDEIECSKQRRSNVEIYTMAGGELKMEDTALFVMTQLATPIVQRRQRHPRKNHSFVWVWRKTDRSGTRI